MYNLTSR